MWKRNIRSVEIRALASPATFQPRRRPGKRIMDRTPHTNGPGMSSRNPPAASRQQLAERLQPQVSEVIEQLYPGAADVSVRAANKLVELIVAQLDHATLRTLLSSREALVARVVEGIEHYLDGEDRFELEEAHRIATVTERHVRLPVASCMNRAVADLTAALGQEFAGIEMAWQEKSRALEAQIVGLQDELQSKDDDLRAAQVCRHGGSRRDTSWFTFIFLSMRAQRTAPTDHCCIHAHAHAAARSSSRPKIAKPACSRRCLIARVLRRSHWPSWSSARQRSRS